MNEQEHFFVVAMEECNEVAHRIAKAARFGMDQIQQDANDKPEENPEGLTNRERIAREYWQLRAMLGKIGIDAWTNTELSKRVEREKIEKVQRYFERSRANGTLNGVIETELSRCLARADGQPRCLVTKDGKQCTKVRFHEASMNATRHTFEGEA